MTCPAEIVVWNDSGRPFPWRWVVRVEVPHEYMSGYALTRNRAWQKAERAYDSLEVVTYKDSASLRRVA